MAQIAQSMGLSILLPSLLSILVLLYQPSQISNSSSSPSSQNTFLQCLLNHSQEQSHHYPVSSAIFTPNNASFSSILQSYIRNLRFNNSYTTKPFLILTPFHVSHIQAAVICGRNHNLQMKIRSGGHDYEGVSYRSESHEPFFILDMFNLRSIDIGIDAETASVQTGATLGELYYRIAEKSKIHGFPAGVCPTVGVGGHISGAGYGNMMRKYGVSADNVIDAEIVDVHGRLLDRKSMGEDLFWAITGGGGASFGVVISYKLNLVRVPEVVTVFEVSRTLEQNATDVLHKWQHVATTTDNDLFIRVIIQVVNGTIQKEDKTVKVTFIALFLGDSKRLVSLMEQSFPELGLKESDCIETSWLRTVWFWANIDINTPLEVMLERNQSVHYLKRKSDYVKEPISKEGFEQIWKKMIELKESGMYFNPYGGRMAEISPTSIPFPHRAGYLWKIQYHANWYEEGKEVADYHIGQVRKLHKFMTQFVSKNPRAAFLNYKDLDLGIISQNNGKTSCYKQGKIYGEMYFKENFHRLVQIKTKVDPFNFFRSEQSIPILSDDDT